MINENKLINERTQKNLRYSTTEGVFNASSSSILNTFIIPFALSIGASNFYIGLLGTFESIATTFSQIPGAFLTNYIDRKTIWLISQSFCRFFVWIPVFLIPFVNNSLALVIFLILVSVAAFFSTLRSPAWSSLMGDIVPPNIRGIYFGKRNMITGIAGIITTVLAGYFLGLIGFYPMFIAMIILGLISIPFFLKMYEPPAKKIYHYRHTINLRPKEWVTSIKVNKNLVLFTLYIFAMNFATEMAAPFYVVYMLKNIGIDYFTFGLLIVIGALARILTFRYWGKMNDRFGSRKTFIITGVFACFVPFGWMFASSVWMIAIIKIYDGIIFSGFDQIWFTYLLDVTPADKRLQHVANHNFFSGFGIISGTFIGGLLATVFEPTVFFIFSGLQIVFLLSFVTRVGTLPLLFRLKEVYNKQTEVVPLRYVFLETTFHPAKEMAGRIHYTFMHPQEFRDGVAKAVEKSLKTVEYKMKMKRN